MKAIDINVTYAVVVCFLTELNNFALVFQALVLLIQEN